MTEGIFDRYFRLLATRFPAAEYSVIAEPAEADAVVRIDSRFLLPRGGSLPQDDVTHHRRHTMHTKISSQTKRELLHALRERYRQASKIEKSRILDEYIALAECHRKHAIRLLTGMEFVGPKPPTKGGRIYSEAVRQALLVLWEAADRICGKRLKAVLPSLIAAMERHQHLALDPAVRELVLAASAATIDRLLTPVRATASRRKKRKTATKPSKQIPIRTFADWKDPEPGFLEIDFVSHGGTSMQGVFLWSLVATDVCSGWTEMIPLVAREQSLVVEGLGVHRHRARRLPR